MRETNKKQTATTTTPITTTPTTAIDKAEAVVEAVADIKKAKEEAKMTTRPRRDSTSSLAAATQLKAQKDGAIGRTEINASSSSSSSNIHHNQVSSNKKPIVRMDRNKEVEKEATKYAASNSPPKNTPTSAPTKPPRIPPQPDPELGTTSKIEDNNRYT